MCPKIKEYTQKTVPLYFKIYFFLRKVYFDQVIRNTPLSKYWNNPEQNGAEEEEGREGGGGRQRCSIFNVLFLARSLSNIFHSCPTLSRPDKRRENLSRELLLACTSFVFSYTGVNFINILRSPFLPIFLLPNNYKHKV